MSINKLTVVENNMASVILQKLESKNPSLEQKNAYKKGKIKIKESGIGKTICECSDKKVVDAVIAQSAYFFFEGKIVILLFIK